MGLHILLLQILPLITVINAAQSTIQARLSQNASFSHPITPVIPYLDEASIDELNDLLNSGTVTSVDLVEAYVKRTQEVNGYLHTVSEIDPYALHIAQARDGERRVGLSKGPLHGIPIFLKDNIATTDSLNTTAGSYALVGAKPKHEATVVRKLRDAGAIILGKVTMGEWAQFRSSFETNSHGWSPLTGQTLGAYYPQQDPHGSSSGSAVAISVGLAAASLGTETSGSIVNPAERNNIVGIKPTLGLTSRNMVIPISLRQDSVGPMAKTVRDAAHLLTAIAGRDPQDNWTDAQPFSIPPDYARACRLSALRGARIGIPRNGISPHLTEASEPIMAAFESALDLMRHAGASLVDHADFASYDKQSYVRNTKIVLGTDFESGLEHYLANLQTNPHHLRNLKDLLRFTQNHPLENAGDHDLIAWENQIKRNLTSDSEESRAAYQANVNAGEHDGVVGALDRYNLDVLVMPTFASFYLPAIAGLPVITVPLGYYPEGTLIGMNLPKTMINVAPGIPFGLAFIGRKWSEETLISLAYAFEQRTMARRLRKPLVRPTIELLQQTAEVSSQFSGINLAASLQAQVKHSNGIMAKMSEYVSRVEAWKLPTFGVSY